MWKGKGSYRWSYEKKQVLKPSQKMVIIICYLFLSIRMRSKVAEPVRIKESNNATEEPSEGIFRCFKICVR